MFDVLAEEVKAVYKSKDICPRELKLEKKNTCYLQGQIFSY